MSKVPLEGSTSRGEQIANIVLSPTVGAGDLIQKISPSNDLEFTEAVRHLNRSIARMAKGDYSDLDAMLFSQAKVLNDLFMDFAKTSLSAPMPYKRDYYAMAMKAQNQSRATMATLIKSKQEPAKATFIKQANITSGNQQVNNGEVFSEKKSGSISTHSKNPQNKLLEDQSHGGTYLDDGAERKAEAGYQEVEAVGEINRRKNT